MRQNTQRRVPEKRAPNASGAAGPLRAGVDAQLDLGLAVSVYCAVSGHPLLPEDAAEGASALPPDEPGASFTEH
jgi:hypothetical protein